LLDRIRESHGRAGAYNAGIDRALKSGASHFLLLHSGLVADNKLIRSLEEVSLEIGDHIVLAARIFSKSEPWIVLNGGMHWYPTERDWLPLMYSEASSEEPLVLADRVDFVTRAASPAF
jgi:GT2 family glycosyltransferase